MIAAAWLGGDLVYHEQIGVDHSSGRELPDTFTPVLADEDLPEGEPRRAMYKETPLLLVRDGSRVYCLAETCAHLGGPLSEGKLEEGTIVCPWHASRFDLATGEALDGPTAFPQPCLETRMRKGQIEVRLSGASETPIASASASVRLAGEPYRVTAARADPLRSP